MLVEETLSLSTALAHTSYALSANEVRRINEDAKSVLGRKDGFLAHMTEFKIVRCCQANYLNMRLRREYLHAIFCRKVSVASVSCSCLLFIPSDKVD